MKLDQILDYYVNHKEGHERKIGRYWASDIYAIKKGYLTPKNFFESKVVEPLGQERIVAGIGYEMLLNDMLKKVKAKYDYNPKTVYQINDEITLVVKPDFVFDDYLWEVKTPSKKYYSVPEKWQYQIECEVQTYNRPAYLVVLSFPFHRDFIPYKSSKIRWNNIQKTLIEFHKQLKQLEAQKETKIDTLNNKKIIGIINN